MPSSGLIYVLSQPSKTDRPKDSMHIARWLLKAALVDIRPYRALTITAVFLASFLNSGPNIVHTFSVTGDCTYALKILPNLTSRSLRAAIIKDISTISLDTTLAYIIIVSAMAM